MSRTLLRFLNPFLFILLLILGVGVQTALHRTGSFHFFQIDLILVAVVWCALRRSFEEGGCLTLLFAEIAEIHSSSPRSLFLMSFILLYFCIRMADQIFIIQTLKDYSWTLFWATWLWKGLEWGLSLVLLGMSSPSFSSLLLDTTLRAFLNTLFVIWGFQWLEHLDVFTYQYDRLQGKGKKIQTLSPFYKELDDWAH